VFVDEVPEQSVAVPTTYWLYCSDPAWWYPYVQKSAKQWQPEAPQSVPPPSR